MLPGPAALLQRLGSPAPHLTPNAGGPASQNISNVRELSNTNNDRHSTPTPTVAQLAQSPATRASIGAIMRIDPSTRNAPSSGSIRSTTILRSPVSKIRREQAELLMSLGEQFSDSTIPDGDPLPDVDSEATTMLLDISSKAQNSHHRALLESAAAAASAAATASAANAVTRSETPVHTPLDHKAADARGAVNSDFDEQKESQVDLTRRRTLYDLTQDSLLPLQSKMSGAGDAVERWTNGPTLRHMKGKTHHIDEGGRSRGHTGSPGAGPGGLHVTGTKSGQKKEYPCSQCGRVFHSRSELRHHARRYEQRPYKCDQCDRSFLYPKDLRRHKTTHTGSKQYKCRICPKSFSRKDNLRRHINNEHDKTDVPLSPSIDAMDVTETRQNENKSEDSEEGGPPNDHHNGYPYGNGVPQEGQYPNQDEMQTDVREVENRNGQHDEGPGHDKSQQHSQENKGSDVKSDSKCLEAKLLKAATATIQTDPLLDQLPPPVMREMIINGTNKTTT